jgi:hypothetical protein
MKIIILLLLLLCCIIIYRSCQEYFEFRENYTEVNFLPRKLVGNALCMKDDIELTDSLFKCKMNDKYSPINSKITTIKYHNFAPLISLNQSPSRSPSISPSRSPSKSPSPSFSLLGTLTPSLTPPPIFSDDNLKLIGTTTDPVTRNVSLNDYKKLMKITNYGNNMIFDNLTQTPTIEVSSLEDVNNSLLYLPDCILPYIKYLYDMKLLQSFIDINKINTISNIAEQFQSYIKGLLIEYKKPETNNFKLDREIVIIYTSDKKNIVNIKFNQTISYYDSNNNLQNNTISININTKYDYIIINSYIDAKLQDSTLNFIDNVSNTIKIYGSALKSRQLIDDYDIDDLVEKIKNIETNNILYVNYLLNGIQLVKRVNGDLVFIDYFELVNFNYYKNMCPDPANNFFYKGRCYSNCPKNYSNIGLTCVLNDETNTHEINKLFDPDSNFCKQLCERSYDDISRHEQIMQQACWCETMSCNKCGEFSIGQCNC